MSRAAITLCLLSCGLASRNLAAEPHLPIESIRSELRPNGLIPLLERGELALIEATETGGSKQIAVMTKIAAPPEAVYDAIFDVEAYPRFLKGMKKTRITRRAQSVLAYEWQLDVPVFDLSGQRAMRGQRPRLIEVRGTGGHFKTSQDRWELHGIDGGQNTLAVLHRALEFKDAGLVLRAVTQLEPSMANALSLAMAFVQVRSLRLYLEKRPTPSYRPLSGPVPELEPIPFGAEGARLEALEPLLRRGLLALVESDSEGSLRQATIWARAEAPVARVRAVVLEASEYARFIPTFRETKLSRMKEGHFRLEWTLDIPLVAVSGVTEIFDQPSGVVDMLAVSGDVKRARWKWAFVDEKDRSLIVHQVYSDVREASWFVEKLVEHEPLLEHGIVVASSAIGVQAIKTRSEGLRPDAASVAPQKAP